jgi:hypothetical protein
MSRWRQGALAALSGMLLSAAGCSSPTAAPPPPLAVPQPVPEPRIPAGLDEPDIGNACREQMASLEDWLTSIEQAGLPLSLSLLDAGTHLVERSGMAVREAAPLAHLTRDQVFLDGVPVADSAALEAELTALIELRRSMMPESPFIQSPSCHFAIDADVPWSRVVEVTGHATRGGVERLTFLFRDPTRSIPAPPPSPIDREIERMSRGTQLRRQQITAELLAFVYQDCPEGLKVIASMGVNPIADFKQVILGDFPAAIGACGCAPDDASLKALHWAIFGNPRPTSGVTVALSRPVTAPPPASTMPSPAPASPPPVVAQEIVVVALEEAQPWSEAHAAVTAVARPGDAASDGSPPRVARFVVKQPKDDKKTRSR